MKENSQKSGIWKRVLLHAGLVLAMLVVACLYFRPVLEGKVVNQGDTQMVEAMMKETKDYHAQTGDYALWNSAMFSGMPIYQVGGNPPTPSVFTPLHKIGTLQVVNMDVARSIGVLFFYLIGFYVALLALGCSPWLALLGALAFGLGSYNIIIVEAGHITKAWAMAMMAPVLAGMVLCLRKKTDKVAQWRDWLWGGLLFTVALGLQLMCNHIQITYYTIIGAVLLGVTYLCYAIAEKRLAQWGIGVGLLLVGCGLAFACNARNLMVSQQYTAYTMRGGNVITVTPDDLYHDGQKTLPESGKKSGLDIDYAFAWSYGVGETYTLLVPGAMGGGSGEMVSRESASYKAFHQQQMPLYWGDQPFTSGPVYFGAIVVFLALLGVVLVKGPERWWLLAATVVAVLMSWGRNLMGFNEWLFDNLPLYNKFRTPSMALVLANVCMVLLGMLGLKELFSEKVEAKSKRVALYVSGGITVGVLLIGLLFSGGLSYSGRADVQMAAQYGQQWEQILDVFVQDRQALFVGDSWRSMLFVALAFVALWVYVKVSGKGKRGMAAVVVSLVLVVLTVVDLWGVDNRYLNEKNYVSGKKVQLRPDPWDLTIDEQAARYGDQDYRVLNLATNTFNHSKSAAFHHQVGGYSAVKMRRYQDIIDFYLSGHINHGVLNMLNARYIIMQGGQVQRNEAALGNCWFVSEIEQVEDSNGEILALNSTDLARVAVVNRNEFEVELPAVVDTTATIMMEHQKPYNPDYLKYHTSSTTPQLAVFSEVYYEPDWRAYIDGKPAKYVRANYLLRALEVPAGEHVVEFKNEAPLFHKMNRVALIGSVLLVVIVAGCIVVYYRKKKEQPC